MEGKGSKNAVVGIITLVAVIGGILGLVYGGRMVFGSAEGEKCTEDMGCKPGAICLGKRCRTRCKKDSDCAPGWSCRGTSVSISSRKSYKITSINICFSPESMVPVLAAERQTKLRDKKRSVDLRVIVLLTTKPPQLSSAEFDAAWAQIPEAEQESATVDALAKRVVAIARGQPAGR